MRWKIVGPYAVLSLVLALFGAFFVTRLVIGSLEERFANQLAEASRSAADAVVRQERDHLATGRAIAFTQGFATELSDANGNAVGAIALPVAANQNAERVEVLDTSGRRVFGVRAAEGRHVTLAEPMQRSGWSFVQRVLDPNAPRDGKFAGIVDTTSGPVLYSATPVRASDGRLVGAVLVGTSLRTFAARAKGEALADVTIYDDGGRVVTTTFPLSADATEQALGMGERGAEAGLVESRTVAERGYSLLYSPLRIRGDQWGWYAVALPRSFVATSVATARSTFAALFAAATAGVLLIGWMIARALTRPLASLVSSAHAISRGDLTARTGLAAGDEIGELAGAFDIMAARLQRSHVNTLGALVSSIDARDAYTRGHSVRVGYLAEELGRAMGLTSRELQHLQVGGLLHDVGKIGIRDAVLLKPGQLTQEERAAIQEHPRIGLRILETVELPHEVIQGVGGHHERINGSGYPLGLSDDAVSIFPRIISVADVYDALITDRPYRPALPLTQVLQILDEECERGLLDVDIVQTIHRIAAQWEERRRSDVMLEGFTLEMPAPDMLRQPVRVAA